MGTGQERERRLVFGEDAEGYDAGRPSYPAEMIDDIVELVGTEARVVDVGTGTAKGTRLLAERGMRGVGVEPDPAMAAVGRRHLNAHPGWRVDESDFEHWEPRNGDVPVDLVSAAQAFHWVNLDVGLPKVAELLRPGGWLAVWWNLSDDDTREVRLEIDAVYDRHAPGEPFCPQIKREVSLLAKDPPAVLSEGAERLYRWTWTYTTDELLALLRTHSNHKLMRPKVLARVLDNVAAVVDRHGGTFDYPYVTRLRTIQRR